MLHAPDGTIGRSGRCSVVIHGARHPMTNAQPRSPGRSPALAALLAAALAAACNTVESPSSSSRDELQWSDPVASHAQRLIDEGRRAFRDDTFGDEAWWGDGLGLHRAIEGAALGGVGPGVGLRAALSLGLKVDVDALPYRLRERLEAGAVNLDDPATTLALLRLNAVVGLTGFFHKDGGLRSIGVQCALCHASVDSSFSPGIGHRLDGWANRDLNIGALLALAPDLTPLTSTLSVSEEALRSLLNAWGPGKFDARLALDGEAQRPDGETGATLIPPVFGLAGVDLDTGPGCGSVSYWNAFMATVEMHGQGTFEDARLDDARRFPVAARERLGHLRHDPDLVSRRLPALAVYELSIAAPEPPEGSFDPAAAARGEVLFNGAARCATCHVPPLFTEVGENLHAPADIGIDAFQSSRSFEQRYRTAPLRGLWTHTHGGFYHDGRYATLSAVVDHYDRALSLGLDEAQRDDLVEYLKTL
jgi:hypothetical protein